jgi:hypothetical protein
MVGFEPEPHQNLYPEPELHQDDAAPQHWFFLNLSILNIRFGAGAAYLCVSGCTERIWLLLH